MNRLAKRPPRGIGALLAAGVLACSGCPGRDGRVSTYPPATSPPDPAPRAQRPGPKVRLLSPRQAQEELRSKGDVFLLCVAGREDYDRGHIAGSVLIPATALRHGLEKNILYPEINRGRAPRKDQPVVFYCWWKTCECPDVPTFSDYAAKVLVEKGYTDLGMIDGGMRSWLQAKLPVERAAGPSMK